LKSERVITVRRAGKDDLETLLGLEEKGFRKDQFQRHQFRHLLNRGKSSIFIAEHEKKAAGMAVMLWKKNLSQGRLYDIVVDPKKQGSGLGARLLRACEFEALRKKCRLISLEVRSDNRQAIAFYEKHGFGVVKTVPDYYSDHCPALKMVKPLGRRTVKGRRLKVPYHAQSLPFTCGPACLMMAMKYFQPETKLTRILELNLWKEATLIFMTSGIGGTGPFGLALAALKRNFRVKLIISRDYSPFFSSVRNDDKRQVIKLVHEDLKEKALERGARVVYGNLKFTELAHHMRLGYIPIVLVSTFRLHGDRAPHWVVVTGFDKESVYLHDPYLDFYGLKGHRARNIKIPLEQFTRMRQYGKDKYKSVVLIGAPRDSNSEKDAHS